ncbi:hypothetical protein WJX81_008548 [Elliptochloris bilobata]|uniref:Fe2OG dioxygenase domain-containing protein n=1 Tax=Elliptochloris bilobata TaxID=381761 RepID=A0AAW1SJJ7_9CHLO
MAEELGLERSMLSGGLVSSNRTSYSTFCSSTPVVQTIHSRVSGLLGAHPPWFGGYESLQVVRYRAGQKFLAHMDSVPGSAFQESVHNRVATCLIYLSSGFAGGETRFPCFGSGYTVTPELGKAVLWFNHRASDGSTLEPYAKHAGLEVLSGEKWVCTQWLKAGHYGSA